MGLIGIEAICPKRNLSKPYPSRSKIIKGVRQIWGIDIAYIEMKQGGVCLVPLMDPVSRYTLSWDPSITLEIDFCMRAPEEALDIVGPEIFNSDLETTESQRTIFAYSEDCIRRL